MTNPSASHARSLAGRLLVEPARPRRIRDDAHAHWYVVATVCIGAFMGQLDASIVTIALPRIGHDLHSGVGTVEWVALAYLLVLVATVAAIGDLADAFGRKLLYVYGFGVFTLGSALCGIAPTVALLIAARLLQGIGAAMLQANSLALIAEAMPGRLLARAVGVQGAAQALGLALGPAVGGALLAIGGWRLIFLVNLPPGLLGLALGCVLLPRSRFRRPDRPSRDRLGALLLALSVAGPLVFVSLGTHLGYGDAALLGALAAGLLAGVALVVHERRHSAPLIDLSVLRQPRMAIGLGTSLVSYLVLFGTLVVVSYDLVARGVGSAEAGLRLAALPLGIGIAGPIAGRHVARLGTRLFTAGGLIAAGLGLLVIVAWHGGPGMTSGLALAGLGIGAFTPANNATIMGNAPPGRAGLLSGILNMTRGLGTALGIAIATLLYTAGAGAAHAEPGAPARGLELALAGLAIAALLAGITSASRRRAETQRVV